MAIKRTPLEIETEIAALEKLEATPSIHARKINADLEFMVECLKGEVDPTSEEFFELSHEAQDTYHSVQRWMDGGDERPAEFYELGFQVRRKTNSRVVRS